MADKVSIKEDTVVEPIPPPDFSNAKSNTTEASCIGSTVPSAHITKVNLEPSYIGPQLPPHMLYKSKEESVSPDSNSQPPSSKEECSPSPESSSFGPQLPPHMLRRNIIGHSTGSTDVKAIGPALPPHLRKQLEEEAEQQSSAEDPEVYGPLPAGTTKYSPAGIALEERALQLRIDKLGSQGIDVPTRESWMTELPEAKAANFGLGPRQFRNRAAPDLKDRSSWTEIGGEKGKQKTEKKKIDLKAEAEYNELRKRDKEQELLIKRHKRESESLVESHQKKLKKKKEDSGVAERKPFSRENDLQVNRFDEAQKKAVLKKAQLLDTRFSSGQSKYL